MHKLEFPPTLIRLYQHPPISLVWIYMDFGRHPLHDLILYSPLPPHHRPMIVLTTSLFCCLSIYFFCEFPATPATCCWYWCWFLKLLIPINPQGNIWRPLPAPYLPHTPTPPPLPRLSIFVCPTFFFTSVYTFVYASVSVLIYSCVCIWVYVLICIFIYVYDLMSVSVYSFIPASKPTIRLCSCPFSNGNIEF